MKILTERGYSFTTTAETGIVCNVKEKLCYMSLDYDTELKSTSESSDKIQTYELPDRNITSLGAERFRSTSVLPASVIGIQASGILDFFPEQHEVLRELPQGVIRQCRVAKRQDFESEVFWDTMVGNCQNYSGSTGPLGVEADGEISCSSEGAG